jgi:hypothetical protein
MSRVKQFIHDHSPEFSDSEIQAFIHSSHSSQKQKIQDFDFLFQFLIFYFLKIK